MRGQQPKEHTKILVNSPISSSKWHSGDRLKQHSPPPSAHIQLKEQRHPPRPRVPFTNKRQCATTWPLSDSTDDFDDPKQTSPQHDSHDDLIKLANTDRNEGNTERRPPSQGQRTNEGHELFPNTTNEGHLFLFFAKPRENALFSGKRGVSCLATWW